jgi:hypothetical protein
MLEIPCPFKCSSIYANGSGDKEDNMKKETDGFKAKDSKGSNHCLIIEVLM